MLHGLNSRLNGCVKTYNDLFSQAKSLLSIIKNDDTIISWKIWENKAIKLKSMCFRRTEQLTDSKRGKQGGNFPQLASQFVLYKCFKRRFCDRWLVRGTILPYYGRWTSHSIFLTPYLRYRLSAIRSSRHCRYLDGRFFRKIGRQGLHPFFWRFHDSSNAKRCFRYLTA